MPITITGFTRTQARLRIRLFASQHAVTANDRISGLGREHARLIRDDQVRIVDVDCERTHKSRATVRHLSFACGE